MKENHLKFISVISSIISFTLLGAAFYVPRLYQTPPITDDMYSSAIGLKAIIANQFVEIGMLKLTNILEIGFIFFLGVAVCSSLYRRITILEKKMNK